MAAGQIYKNVFEARLPSREVQELATCFAHGFEQREEFDRAQALRERLVADLEAGKAVPTLWPVAVAAYFPLLSLPCADTLQDRSWPESVRALLVQQIAEPLEERRYRDGVVEWTADGTVQGPTVQ